MESYDFFSDNLKEFFLVSNLLLALIIEVTDSSYILLLFLYILLCILLYKEGSYCIFSIDFFKRLVLIPKESDLGLNCLFN